MSRPMDTLLQAGNRRDAARLAAQHIGWEVDGKVATLILNRPERKNPLTFESYAELRDTFRQLLYADDVKALVHRVLRHRVILGFEAVADDLPVERVIDAMVGGIRTP